MERIAEILAYELSKSLEYKEVHIQTPLAATTASVLKTSPYLITIMRAGIPFFQGFLNFFDEADCGFIGAFRSDTDKNNEFEIDMDYMAVGDINAREIILIDPMLATGKSIVKAIENMLNIGKPKKIHIASLIASRQGYEYVKNNTNFNTQFWVADMDDQLNDRSFIVPGLGDAGDLSFGKKT
jgi:uracil phosphoribosyltransferase